MPKYIIQITDKDHYPFQGNKQHCNPIIVRKIIPISSQEEETMLQKNIQKLVSINCEGLIEIKRVIERRGKQYVIDYQYVPESLARSPKLSENSFVLCVKEKLLQLCQKLTKSGIKIDLKKQDIGLTTQGQLKLFISHKFQHLNQNSLNGTQDYQIHIDRIIEQYSGVRHSLKAPSELSDYSTRLDKKITMIEDKINRRKRRKSKGASSLQKDNKSEKDKKVALISPTDLNDKNQSESQTSERTRYSTIQINQMNQMTKPKHHRGSFNDFQTTSYQLNQSQRQDSLKKRFEKALEKTQEAFKVYDKYSKRSRRF